MSLRMSREEYRTVYLASDHWRELRRDALERAGNRCQVCNGAKHLDVHHRTYERLGCEEPADLTVLCRNCHELFHAKAKVVPSRPSRKVAKDNWSQLSVAEQARLSDALLGILRDGAQGRMTAAEAAFLSGQRSQVVGACFTSLKKRGLVRKDKKGWRLTSRAIEVAA